MIQHFKLVYFITADIQNKVAQLT